MAELTASRLSIGYGARPILHDVSLALCSGELVAVVGPNGCGKTTLVRALSGALTPAQGQVRLDGRPIADWGRQGWARRLAVVSQEGLPDLEMTVAELVALGRYPHLGRWRRPGPADRQAVARALAATETTDLAARRLGALSGGERQRVNLARALAQEPDLLLLDEPASHLDLHHQMATFDLLRRLVAAGLAVLAVLHDLNLAAVYCPRIVLVNDGHVVQDGPAEAVLAAVHLEPVYRRPVLITRHPALPVPQVTLLPAGEGRADVR